MGCAHRTAKKLHLKTMLLLTRQTEFAFTARATGAQGHTITGAHTADMGADGLNSACHFMAHDDRFGDANRTDPALPVIMDI